MMHDVMDVAGCVLLVVYCTLGLLTPQPLYFRTIDQGRI